MQLVARGTTAFSIDANQPLYQRVPVRDESGRLLSDFMVILPGLRERPRHEFADTLARLQAVLVSFSEVVFVDLNVPLNILWVSVRSRPGVILDLFDAVKMHLPEAKLVGHRRE